MRNKRYSQVAAGNQLENPVCQRLHRRAASQVGMFYGGWLKGEAREYQEKLQLDGEQYREFSETANCLFDAQRPDVRFNDVGLLCNVFSEVEGVTRQIQGKGEPVKWIPCRIRIHGQNAEFDRLTGGGKWEKQGQRERQDSPHGQSVF